MAGTRRHSYKTAPVNQTRAWWFVQFWRNQTLFLFLFFLFAVIRLTQVNCQLPDGEQWISAYDDRSSSCAEFNSASASGGMLCHFFVKRSARSTRGTEFKLHLKETVASGIKAVVSFPILQREESYKPLNKLWVREVFKDDLLALNDTQKKNTESNNSYCLLRSLLRFCMRFTIRAPRSSLRTTAHLSASPKLHGSSSPWRERETKEELRWFTDRIMEGHVLSLNKQPG